MIKYQGEDIPFKLQIKVFDNEGAVSNIQNLLMYFYTDVHVAKFSIIEKDGYNKLLSNGEDLLTGVIQGADTKKMNGLLKVDVLCIKTYEIGDLEESMIQAGQLTGITINTSIIKSEIV